MEKIFNELNSFLKSLICFLVACSLLPVLLISFLCVHYSNELVNYVLEIKYPALTISKSKKIRTLIDTPRNAGIFHFLLQVKGTCNFEKIRQHYYENLIDKRDGTGKYRYPKLRQQLVTCWGHYGWVNDTSAFKANNHITLSSSNYRGRPINDGNMQEFISDLVTKYIPSDLPQWQVIVIPTTVSTSSDIGSDQMMQAEYYYILVKVHHLLIAEEEELRISDMLMLAQTDRKPLIKLGSRTTAVDSGPNLSYFVRRPVHIENLYRHIKESTVNRWNEFIYKFDSLETPDGDHRIHITNITQLGSVFIISFVNALIEYWSLPNLKGACDRQERQGRLALFLSYLLSEVERRNISLKVVYDAIIFSLNPVNVVKNTLKLLWIIILNYVLLLPYHLFRELTALKDVIFVGRTKMSMTICGVVYEYIPLVIYAQVELIRICFEIFKAPCHIFEELFQLRSKESNILQVKSYSGRKIVSFTKSISGAEIRKRLTGHVHESDFVLSCLAGALRDYFASFSDSHKLPAMLNTTCRTIAKDYFTQNKTAKMDHIGGVVFMQLPLRIPCQDHAKQIHDIIETIRQKQNFIYLASMAQTKYDFLTAIIPRVLTKIFINYFSLNFPVTLTQIYGSSSEFKSVWGQKVDDVLLFRPPQSKTCLSLNIHHFGDKYRLAIMADTQLGPEHYLISSAFETYMENVSM